MPTEILMFSIVAEPFANKEGNSMENSDDWTGENLCSTLIPSCWANFASVNWGMFSFTSVGAPIDFWTFR